MLTFVNSFNARVLGYYAILTDDYPPIGIERAKPAASRRRSPRRSRRLLPRLRRRLRGMSETAEQAVAKGDGLRRRQPRRTSARGRASARSARSWA